MRWHQPSETKDVKLRYKVGIATKIIFIVTLIVVSAIGVVVYIAVDLFREDSVTRVQETNQDTAAQVADRVHAIFQESSDKMSLLAQFATRSPSKEEAQRAIENTIASSEDLVSFFAAKITNKGELEEQFFATNESSLAEFNLTPEKVKTSLQKELFAQQTTAPNEVQLLNSSPQFGVPLFTLTFLSQAVKAGEKAVPNISSLSGRWWFRAEIRQDKVLKLFSSKKFITMYLVDSGGHLMAHSDQEMSKSVIQGVKIKNPIVDKMLEGGVDNHEMSYADENNEKYLGAFRKVGVAGIGVVAEVAESKALATIERVQYRSFLVMIVVVCIAFCLNFWFSQSLTSNLKKLFAATEQVVDGKFDVELQVNSSDEIGALAKAFVGMASGLKEREKIKDVMDKFHSKEVAKKLMSGEIKLGGEKKHATIFFSDIRSFTAISEKMTPDQVVTMLNEYFTAMVRIVYKWHGIVDKYIGDAILAGWGVLEGSPKDAYNAVRAGLEMREYLSEFNKTRRAKGLFEIKIGMGLHSGEVLAGNIGAYDKKLDYTVIGDTVNQASRIEGACKAAKSDFLISGDTYALVQKEGIEAGPGIEIKAKGKTHALVVHQVIGYKDAQGQFHTSLSDEEIETIKNQATQVEAEEEEKSQIAKKVQHTESSIEPSPIPIQTPPIFDNVASITLEQTDMPKKEDANEVTWYVVDNPGSKEYQGPFSLSQISVKLAAGQFDYASAYTFKMGDSQMTAVNQIPELERRTVSKPPVQDNLPETVIRNQAEAEDWFVAGPNGQSLGPYSEDDLRIALGKGNLTRTTFVWRKGLANWIPLHDIPGFDRRTA